MDLIVAVYDDWGIGRDGTQPVALSADRKFFRETTRGAMVIAGRRTIDDFPGKKALPGRVNISLSRTVKEIPGFTVCATPEEAIALTKDAQKVFVIGGGVSEAGEILIDYLKPYFDRYSYPGTRNVQFRLAKLGNDAGIYGAAGLIIGNKQ